MLKEWTIWVILVIAAVIFAAILDSFLPGVNILLAIVELLTKRFGVSPALLKRIVAITLFFLVTSQALDWLCANYLGVNRAYQARKDFHARQVQDALDPNFPARLTDSVYNAEVREITNQQVALNNEIANLPVDANGLLTEASRRRLAEIKAELPKLEARLETIRRSGGEPLKNSAERTLGFLRQNLGWGLLAFGTILILLGALAIKKALPGGKIVALLGGAALIWGLAIIFIPQVAPAPPTTGGLQITAPGRQVGTWTIQVPANKVILAGINIAPGQRFKVEQAQPRLFYLKGAKYDVPVRTTRYEDFTTQGGPVKFRGGPQATTVTLTLK
jgi:hypothetical protein